MKILKTANYKILEKYEPIILKVLESIKSNSSTPEQELEPYAGTIPPNEKQIILDWMDDFLGRSKVDDSYLTPPFPR